jgi:hypothetical protein
MRHSLGAAGGSQVKSERNKTIDISVEEGQCIIIVIGKGLKEGFLRADLNGIEIPFTEIMLDINYNETLEEDNAEYITSYKGARLLITTLNKNDI